MHLDDIKIDPEFQALLPKLPLLKREGLRAKLVAEGFRDPLIVWKGHGILIDGHNRFELCREEGIEPTFVEMEFADRSHAIEWARLQQDSRRNNTPEDDAENMGAVYELRKQRQGGDRKSKGHNALLVTTAEQVAEEFGVSPDTVKRAAEYKRGLDAIEEEEGPEAREEAKKLPMKEVRKKGRKIKPESNGTEQRQTDEEVAKLIATVRKRLQSWPIEQRKAFVRAINKVRAEFGI